jgi:hypothetical protein
MVSAMCGSSCYPIFPPDQNSCDANEPDTGIEAGIKLCEIINAKHSVKKKLCRPCISTNCGSDPFSATLVATCATL